MDEGRQKYVITQTYKLLTDCERQLLVEADSEGEALCVDYDRDANAFIIKDNEFDCEVISVRNIEIETYKEEKHGHV